MQEPYFIRVAKQTPTEFWINNPTRDQADLAIANGATGCTNNPSYSQKMVDHPSEGAYARKLLDEAIKESPNDEESIAIFQRKLVKPISDRFLPIFKKSKEDQGYVSIQATRSTRTTRTWSSARPWRTASCRRISAARSLPRIPDWWPWNTWWARTFR